jgi:hypothetical protein
VGLGSGQPRKKCLEEVGERELMGIPRSIKEFTYYAKEGQM